MIPYDKKRRLQRKIVGQVPKTAGLKLTVLNPKPQAKACPLVKGWDSGKKLNTILTPYGLWATYVAHSTFGWFSQNRLWATYVAHSAI